MKTKLYYAGQPGQGYGWGTCNTYLIRELSKLCDLRTVVKGQEGTYIIGSTDSAPYKPKIFDQLDGTVFMPLIDHDFNPYAPFRGTRNLAYTFFEFPLGQNAATNAAKYDVVFCGSTWCLERMRERGITNGKVLIQGVDTEIFKPGLAETFDRFTVFSGGKFEYRKGQDIVIAAFREFLKICPDAILVCAWHNLWPQLIETMNQSNYLRKIAPDHLSSQMDYFECLLRSNGIPEKNFRVLPPLPQAELAKWMCKTHVGLFPNRCEGGTNLVLMEYMACGKPVLASSETGQKDIASNNGFYETEGNILDNGWFESDIKRTNLWLNILSGSKDLLRGSGIAACQFISQFTWSRAAQTIMEEVR